MSLNSYKQVKRFASLYEPNRFLDCLESTKEYTNTCFLFDITGEAHLYLPNFIPPTKEYIAHIREVNASNNNWLVFASCRELGDIQENDCDTVKDLIPFFNEQIDNGWVWPLFLGPCGRVSNFKEEDMYQPKKYLFACKNRRSTPHRLIMLDKLAKYNLIDNNCVTLMQAATEETILEYFDGQPIVSDVDYNASLTTVFESPGPTGYWNCLFDIVNETDLLYYYTEKTSDSIINGRPFIIMGAQHMNKRFSEKWGFKLYPELFDYDAIEQHANFSDRAEELARQIKNMRFEDVAETVAKLEKRTKYNLGLLLEYTTKLPFNARYKELLADVDFSELQFEKKDWNAVQLYIVDKPYLINIHQEFLKGAYDEE